MAFTVALELSAGAFAMLLAAADARLLVSVRCIATTRYHTAVLAQHNI